jgi:hypothetical protein
MMPTSLFRSRPSRLRSIPVSSWAMCLRIFSLVKGFGKYVRGASVAFRRKMKRGTIRHHRTVPLFVSLPTLIEVLIVVVVL